MRRQDYQRQIDEEIAEELSAHARRIVELKTRRNTFADVSILPNELLLEIFVLIKGGLRFKDLHGITHVCRRWRDIAVNAPTLWTRPPTHRHEYTCLMLERSKVADLDISISTSTDAETVDLISKHVGRITDLDIYLPEGDQDLEDICQRLIASGHILSKMQELHITDKETTLGKVPLNLVPKPSPLSTFSLWHVTFDWRMLSALDLVSLQLTDSKVTENISAATLLDMLRKMPRLELLCFSADGILLPHGDSIVAEKVHLPHLEHFSIVDCDVKCLSYLLARLECPGLGYAQLETTAESELSSFSSTTLAPIIKFLTRTKFQAGTELLIDSTDIELYLSHAFLIDARFLLGPDDFFDRNRARIFWEQIAPNFNNLVDVCLGIPVDSDYLVQTFGNMHNLQHLSIRHWEILIPAFAIALRSDSGTYERGMFPFPRLETFDCDDIPWDNLYRDEITDFCDALTQRSSQTWGIVVNAKPPLPEWIAEILQGGGVQVTNRDLRWPDLDLDL